jgi:hypothetical protein
MENLILYNSPFPKKRIGKSNDGGYVIAELPKDYDIFISGGISNDISFEVDFINNYSKNIICYAFDGTISSIPNNNNPNIKFIKKNLGNENNENTTNLLEYMNEYNNIFMKMDIEGHEFRIMPVIIEHNYMLNIKQLVIEIHSPGDIQLYPDYFKGLSDIHNKQMFDLLQQINKTHTLVHFHANNGCNMQKIDDIQLPHVFELTFIRNDFISNKMRNIIALPMSIDMPNLPYKLDYYLSGFPYTL